MTEQRSLRAAQFGPFLVAFGLAVPLAALHVHVSPIHVSKIEIGNNIVALAGSVWAAIQVHAHRRSQPLQRAWGMALFATLLLVVEDQMAALVGRAAPSLFALTSCAMWIAAALLFLACGRRYAMRRNVMNAMRFGSAFAAIAIVLSLALHETPLPDPSHRVSHFQEWIELVAVICFVAGLMLAQLAPLKAYAFAPRDIGRRARSLFYDFGLETRVRYPVPHPMFALPGLRGLLTLAVILKYWPVASGAVRRETGRSAWAQLKDLLRLGFAHGVDAKSYYVHDLYRLPQAFDATITRVETKNGLNKALQNLRADIEAPRDMNDKLAFWRICEAHGVPSADILATVETGVMIWIRDRAAFDRDLFVKDRKGRGGRYTLNFERVAPFLYRDDDGATVNLDEVVCRLTDLSAGRRLMIQPKLANHASIRSLADQSLVVFRVMTCMDTRGEPHVTHGVVRILRRFEPNWPKTQDADWGCAIDLTTGELGVLTGDAPETCTRWFEIHPVTGERVTGRVLDGWPEIAEVALAAHRVFASRTLVGWDIGWTPDGPVILEGNSSPDFSYFQRVYRTPVGRSPLGPLLNAHLDALTADLTA